MAKRLIAVEGPDGAGKSTLLKKLSAGLRREVFHTGGPPKDQAAWNEKLSYVFGNAKQGVIFDRLPPISETVYGPIGGRTFADDTELMNRMIKDLDPVVIYCRLPNIDDMAKHIDMSPKPHKPAEHLDQVIARFEQIVRAYDKRMLEVRNLGVVVLPYAWNLDSYPNLSRRLAACVV